MRFFADVEKQAFRTAPDGRRLFYVLGPLSRPYVVPDTGTERRLGGKQRWLLGILLVLVVVGQQVARSSVDAGMFTTGLGVLGYVAFVWVGYLVVQRILFHGELRRLARAESRLSLHDYYADVAARRSVASLVTQIGISLGLVALGVWMVVGQNEPAIGWLDISIFTVTAAIWIYALVLKLSNHTPDSGLRGS
jgi:hypothetical protein